MTATRVIVQGRVQGVGYRAWVLRQAQTRGLSGWVRNRSDGAVEAVLSGPASEVAEMVEACKCGPRHAAVTAVTEEPAQDLPPVGFSVRPTV